MKHWDNIPLKYNAAFHIAKKGNCEINIIALLIDLFVRTPDSLIGGSSLYPYFQCRSKNKENDMFPCKPNLSLNKVKIVWVLTVWSEWGMWDVASSSISHVQSYRDCCPTFFRCCISKGLHFRIPRD